MAVQSVATKHRYVEVALIGEGGMGAVYRVIDRLTNSVVAMKKVIAPPEELLFASQNFGNSPKHALANEFKILSSLRHPNIISVLDYGFDQGDPYFTMNILEQPTSLSAAAKQQPIEGQIGLFIQLLQTLTYLHRRNVIHRDIKPGNVLVSAEGQVKVLDFGLALSKQYLRSHDPSGTIAWLAPEVLNGAPASVASDLYAVGIMLYEVLTGQFPFKASTLPSLIKAVTANSIDLAPVPATFSEIVGRLVSKAPEQRYQTAESLIADLCAAANLPRPAETLAIRDSFLQASAFIGRDNEFDQLKELLMDAESGHGGARLIGGESGVGKSRLLSELRVEALVRGTLVLNGQDIAEGSSPYQVWRNVLRVLSLFIDISDFDATVLKPVIPDLETLLQKAIPDAQQIEPDAVQERLTTAVESNLKQLDRAALIILEDLQWSGQESMVLFNRLAELVKDLPILIIGSYRDDERLDLPNLLPDIPVVKLKRLPPADIASLSSAMLGNTSPHILNFLQERTGGNVFFLVEVMRALAENSGTLDQIAAQPLPETIVAGGISQILHNRLKQLHDSFRQLLEYAGVLGRELNETLLRQLAESVDYSEWLITLQNIAILSVEENRWRFAHDQLREALLASFDSAEKVRLHKQVAQTIVSTYPDNPEWIVPLAYHYEQAQDAPNAADYLERAGQQALQSAGYEQAVDFIDRARAFDGQIGNLPPVRQIRRAAIQGRACYYMGRSAEALPHFHRGFKTLGFPIPSSQPLRTTTAVLGQMGTQIIHRLVPSRYVGVNAPNPELIEAVHLIINMSGVYFNQGDILNTLFLNLLQVNKFETPQPQPALMLTSAYATMSMIAGLIPMTGVADYYQRLALTTMGQSTDEGKANAWILIGMYAMSKAKWQQAETWLTNARELYKVLGNVRRQQEAQWMLATMAYAAGRYTDSVALSNELYAAVIQRHDVDMQISYVLATAESQIRLGHIAEISVADTLFDDEPGALKFFKRAFDLNPANLSHYYGIKAMYQYACQDFTAALATAEQACALATKHPSSKLWYHLNCYDGPLMVCLNALDPKGPVDPTPQRRSELQDTVRAILKQLKAYAQVFPYAAPCLLRHEGTLLWLDGKEEQALKKWQLAAASARKLSIAYEEGAAYLAIGSHLAASDPERRSHLEQAQSLFIQAEAAPDVRQVEAYLANVAS